MLEQREAIRRGMLKKRGGLSETEVQQYSSQIVEHLRRRAEYREARTMMAYAPFRNEVDVSRLLSGWLEEGKTLLLPVTDWDRRIITPVQVKRYPEGLAAGRFGILEPVRSEAEPDWSLEEIDLVLVPGVAFDARGYRLGYGQGFYDRLLARAPQRLNPIGLAYSFQVVDTVFPQPHDFRLPVIVTEDGAVADPGD